jgi:hypothetical protein
MRRIRKISTAAALAISMGAAVSGAIAVPSAQAQTIATAQARQQLPPAAAHARAAKPITGVDLYVNQNYSLSDVLAWGTRDISYISNTLGLKAVSIDWDYNVPSAGSNLVEDSATRTPSIADIRALTYLAKAYGLRVEYRVLFAVDNTDSRDGSIDPANLRLWLDSLYTTEAPALRLAASTGVPGFVVGSEMATIDKSPQWDAFFKKAEKIYKGSLSYASYGGHTNYDGGFFSRSRVELPTNDFGVTAYPAIHLASDASVTALTRQWEKYLNRFTDNAILDRTTIEEVGIPALDGWYSQPWQWDNLTGTADATIQARWFTAACRAVTAEHLRGIYFWSFALNDDPAKPFNSLVGFLGRPAVLNAIKSC